MWLLVVMNVAAGADAGMRDCGQVPARAAAAAAFTGVEAALETDGRVAPPWVEGGGADGGDTEVSTAVGGQQQQQHHHLHPMDAAHPLAFVGRRRRSGR